MRVRVAHPRYRSVSLDYINAQSYWKVVTDCATFLDILAFFLYFSAILSALITGTKLVPSSRVSRNTVAQACLPTFTGFHNWHTKIFKCRLFIRPIHQTALVVILLATAPIPNCSEAIEVLIFMTVL